MYVYRKKLFEFVTAVSYPLGICDMSL